MANTLDLSSVQQCVLLDQLSSPAADYNLGLLLKLDGPLDVDLLKKTLEIAAQRHDALRLVFTERSGGAVQKILDSVPCTLPVVDFSAQAGLNDYVRAAFARPFPLYEAPLWESQLIRIDAHSHYWLHRYHHLIVDGHGLSLLGRSMVNIYNQLLAKRDPLFEPSGSYQEFIEDDQQYLRSARYEADRQFWLQQFPSAPPALPRRDRRQDAQVEREDPRLEWPIARDVFSRMSALAARNGLSVAHFMLALVAVYMSRANAAPEVIVGVSVHNRTGRHKHTVGMFSSVIPVRITVEGSASFLDVMQSAATALRRSYRHQRFPISEINRNAKVTQAARRQLFDVALSVESFPSEAVLGERSVELVGNHRGARATPLMISVHDYQKAADVIVELDYNDEFHDRSTAAGILGHLTVLARAALENPSSPVDRLRLMSVDERRRVIEAFNATDHEYPRDRTLHELIEDQVARTPGAVAILYEGRSVSYAQLNREANKVARYLRRLGAGPDKLVGLCMERSPWMITALLGILKSGSAYVPLDPTSPGGRLQHVLADSRPLAVLTQQKFASTLPADTANVIALDREWDTIASYEDENLAASEIGLQARHLAYVIYTSGSTGKPKGVMIEHSSIVNYAVHAARQFDVAASNGTLLCTSMSFDLGLTSLFPTLICGRPLHVVPDTQDISVLSGALTQSRDLAAVKLTPSHLSALLQVTSFVQLSGRVRTLVLGGEKLTARAVQTWRSAAPQTRIFNHYGPTETTVGCVVHELSAQDADPIPIGKPISNVRIYILDEHREPVPIGVVGEIHIAGAGVARGYFNRPDLTNERFVRDPFNDDPNARMYCSGDLGRWREDGSVECLGRNDQQVKLRGFRIELGEIETQLASHPKIAAAAVVLHDDADTPRLIAYFTHIGDVPTAEELRSHLKSTLPEYMLPAAFMALPALPLTPNGKLDRRALPAPEAAAAATREYEAPQGELEQALADIWSQLLNVERVGRDDHFFDLGGHSLVALQTLEIIKQRFHVDLPLAGLFESPTIALLAASITDRIAAMSDDEVTAMLDQQRKAQGAEPG